MAPHESTNQNSTNPQPGAQYGANQFWGQLGFNDPLVAAKPLQTSATWGGATDSCARRRGPGWLGAIGIAMAASLVTTDGFYTVISSLLAKAEASKLTLFNPDDKGVPTPASVANSTLQNPDWESVTKAVRPAVVAINACTNRGAEQGSGTIIDSSGHILANNYVAVAAADGDRKITVELHDGRLHKAEIVGRDVLIDLAAIKVVGPLKDLTVATLGDFSKLRVGESVAATGNPLGSSSTVTTGIVSALDHTMRVDVVPGGKEEEDSGPGFDLREFLGGDLEGPGDSLIRPQSRPKPEDSVYINAIQVDAAVNPGNSGGPLFDVKGRVIGVTPSIAILSGGGTVADSTGLGFAISINQVQVIATQLAEHGEAVYAALGVVMGDDIASVGGVLCPGASVQEVQCGGASHKADLKASDIIVGTNGKQAEGMRSLIGQVRQYAVGGTVDLRIVYDGKEVKVSVTLQAQ